MTADHPPKDRKNQAETQGNEWTEIMQLSDRLLELAKASDWEQLDELSAEREQMLKDFFGQPIAESLHAGIQEDIRHITEQDKVIVQVVQNNRTELADEITRLQARKRMIKDYLSNSD